MKQTGDKCWDKPSCSAEKPCNVCSYCEEHTPIKERLQYLEDNLIVPGYEYNEASIDVAEEILEIAKKLLKKHNNCPICTNPVELDGEITLYESSLGVEPFKK